MPHPLTSQAQHLKSWLIDAALPFWAENARDDQGLFYEYLNHDCTPAVNAVRRLRVQARQIYTYGLATQLGWYDAADIVRKTWDAMLRIGYMPDGEDGFIHLLNPDYSVNDERRDLYDHAFYLLSAAFAKEHVDDAEPVSSDILTLLNKWASPYGGWVEGRPVTLPRRQNPHMHLFETSLVWMKIPETRIWRNMADHVFGLFQNCFFDARHHIIREFFGDDWTIADGEKGDTVEPGHMAEWVWLLWQYERQTGTDTSFYANTLYDRVLKGPDFFLYDEEGVSGEVRRRTRRLWCQTELVKAHLAQGERGIKGAVDAAAALIDGLMAHYLMPGGCWNDQLDACNANIATTIPTSTLYHIICMIAEVDRIATIQD
ncbi:MAG: AGE family epimerase/isomerase [Hyphomonadaceae bacterium]|nr:AGE family epimerase/isomerase [Hyphomonadaceae bacterium]MBC6412304.1 AGE family epimerase/isomerase [Hyphomonadaceae bacterium]